MDAAIRRAVFIDFDGVLFDTVREVYAVSMLTLNRSTRIIDINFESKHCEKFNQLRYLVGPAWNYYYVMQAVDKEPLGSSSDLKKEYKNLLNQQTEEVHTSFEKKFFQALAKSVLEKKNQKIEKNSENSKIFQNTFFALKSPKMIFFA